MLPVAPWDFHCTNLQSPPFLFTMHYLPSSNQLYLVKFLPFIAVRSCGNHRQILANLFCWRMVRYVISLIGQVLMCRAFSDSFQTMDWLKTLQSEHFLCLLPLVYQYRTTAINTQDRFGLCRFREWSFVLAHGAHFKLGHGNHFSSDTACTT